MGGSSALSKPIKMAQSAGILKKKSAPPAPPKPVAQAPAPTQAEVSQSAAMDQDEYTGVSRRIKRRGRSATIITGPTGVEEQLTLGKKSLLGS
jgi:hypothetical protein